MKLMACREKKECILYGNQAVRQYVPCRVIDRAVCHFSNLECSKIFPKIPPKF